MSVADALAREVGCWSQAKVDPKRFAGRPALFLDRDGVVVEDTGYLARAQDVALVASAGKVIAAFNRAHVPVVLVTNQSGVGRGYFDWSAFEAVQAEIARQLEPVGARYDAVFACGCHETGLGEFAVVDHPWRKPNPGMLNAAADRMGVVLRRSVIVGDRASDLLAGRNAGVAVGVHVSTGQGGAAQRQAALALTTPDFEVRGADDVSGALALLDRLAEPAPC